MKIKDRLKRIKATHKQDCYINVYDNRTEYSPDDIGFYLEDLNEYFDHSVLEKELDNEKKVRTKGQIRILLGFGKA
jgi:CRISPR/Cas system CSM-associated protein Csm5 (group 7 of RAMP superfamily)